MMRALQVAGLLAVGLPATWARPARRAVTSPECYITSADGAYNLSAYTAPVQGTGSTTITSTWKLSVDDTSTGHKQQITGFGAAVTDATVSVISALPADQQSALLAELFTTGPDDGVGFSLMRHTIGASDLSAYAYSYDNVSTADSSLADFSLYSPGQDMVQLIANMVATNPDLKLLGSVWSPPGWMKLNGVMYGTTTNNNLNMDYASAYADYFVKYIQAFAAGGVNVDAITIQNEPLNSQAGYPTMYVSADQETQLIQDYVGPALQSAGLATEIWAYDHNTDVPSFPQTVLDGAGDYVNTVAWHCYAPNNNWDVLTQFQQTNPSVTQYMTECWTSPTNTWYSTTDFVMGPMQNYAAGAMAWTLATDFSYGPHLPGGCTTCRGLVEVDTTAGTYSKTPDYYFMGQFSRFVPRGAIALNTTGSWDYGNGQKLEVAAFLNPDNSRTLVIENGFGNPVYVTVTFNSGETWSGPLYTESVTTWVLPPTTGTA
ncbi:hypothetical protein VTN77DRAFT_4864 [Rasamsonia byssochlamydoides]|uniref:uncharacterized protein n=1 Tax=Rasamsonia byssochlamydoides TaxID=89139 RepID=UPI0037424F74